MSIRQRIARKPMVVGPRRETTWVDTELDVAIAATAGQTQSLMGTMDVDERRGMTVTRILACIYLLPSSVGVADGVMKLSLGIGSASQEAFTAGAIPDPEAAADFPQRGWLYRCTHAVVDHTIPGYPMPAIFLDLHAQRKVDTGEIYLRMRNELQQGSSFSVDVVGTLRMLVKLP